MLCLLGCALGWLAEVWALSAVGAASSFYQEGQGKGGRGCQGRAGQGMAGQGVPWLTPCVLAALRTQLKNTADIFDCTKAMTCVRHVIDLGLKPGLS